MIGQDKAIELILISLAAGGHVLLEDLPGTGKTVLAKSLAKSMDVQYSRIQFTPDLLPSDVTGLNYFNQEKGDCLTSAPSLDEDSSVFPVFISINADETLKEQITEFLGKQKRGLWIVPVEEGEDLPVASGPSLTVMKKVLPHEKHYA